MNDAPSIGAQRRQVQERGTGAATTELRGPRRSPVLSASLRCIPPPPEWRTAEGQTSYADAVAHMQDRVAAIRAGTAAELVWLVEHPPLYTAGTSARPEQLTDPGRFPTFATGRGGQWTYHGPGQRVAYVMLDLTRPHGAVPAAMCGATCTGWRSG